MVFGEPERLETEFLGQDALADLVDQNLLRRFVYFGERAVVYRYSVLGNDYRKTRRAIMKDSDLEHVVSSVGSFCLDLLGTSRTPRPLRSAHYARGTLFVGPSRGATRRQNIIPSFEGLEANSGPFTDV
jgi:hypothetical protein